MADGRVVIDTKLDTSGVESGIRSINNLLKAGFVTKGLSYLKEAISFVADETGKLNDSIRMASTLFGGYDVDMDRLAKNLRRISDETQVAASELGMGLYNALSSGIPASEDMGEALEYVRKNALTAKAGMADLDSTVRASASVMNAYGMTVDDTDRILGIMMNTQNLGITTIGELSTTLAQVIPTAAAFGVSFEEVGAALATMTAMGTQTAQATTGLNNLLSELGRQSQQGAKNLAAAADAAGLGKKSFADLVRDGKSLTDILLMMQDYAEENGQSLVDMFGSIEGGRAALQLVTQEGEKFTKNLESMYDTAGMVEAASESVMTETGRLGKAIANAASAIGQKFLPAWNEVAGVMADTIESLSGNKDKAGELETALENLRVATENYRKAQEDARGATDETTAAMLRQAGEAQRTAILDFAKAYRDAVNESLANADKIKVAEGIIAEMEGKLANLASQAGMTVEEMDRLYATGRLKKGYISEYEQFTHEIEHQREVVAGLTGDIDSLKGAYDEMLYSAVKLAADNAISMEDLSFADPAFARQVERFAESYSRGAELVRMADFSNDEIGEQIELYKEAIAEVEKGTPLYYQLVGALDELTAAYSRLGEAQKGSGTSTITLSAEIDDDAIQKATDKLNESIRASKVEFELFGDETKLVEDELDAFETALQELVEAGLDETDVRVQTLADTIGRLRSALDETKSPLEELGETFKDTFADADMWIGLVSDGIQSAVGAMLEAPERIAELQESTLEAMESLREAQEELSEAKARGDEDAIRNLEEQVKGYNDIIAANKEEEKALKSGEEGWKAFGRSALKALAQVLYGLGEQLAAQAVAAVAKFPQDWVAFGLATAGSLAAIGAGIALDAAAGSFQEGGIVPQVPGVPSTGDRHVAMVNPGELILNRAQQDSIAGQLVTAEAQRALAASAGGSTIVVNLTGAYIYGLDEPAVGRAIYENIRTLQSEGVLR